MIRSIRITAVVIILALIAAACGGRAKVVERAGQFASSAHAGLNAARDSFVSWDAQHQAEIVEQATSLDAGQAALAAYRQKRQRVLAAFQAAYAAVAAVAALVPLVEAEKRTGPELLSALAQAAIAIEEMRDAIAALTKGTP